MDGLPKEISQAAYARRREVSRQYIGRLIKSGKLGLTKSKKINVVAADKVLDALTTKPKELAPVEIPAASADDGIPRAGSDDGLPDDPKKMNRAEAQTYREYYKAQLARLEYEEAVAKLVDAEGVARALTDIGRMVTQKITAWPAQMAPVLAAEADPVEVEAILESSTGVLINELRDNTTRLLESHGRVLEGDSPAAETDG